MIISKTPFRISFFGGGTDYHTWYEKFGGQVLSTTIDHYCYLTCRELPPFFNNKSRIIWSQIEEVIDNNDINHPVINAVLKLLGIDFGMEIHHQADLPSRSGLGSSSTFTVGLLNSVYRLFGIVKSSRELAQEAIFIERSYLKESVGIQDQIAAAYGGFNHITIDNNGEFNVKELLISNSRKQELNSNLMLFFTGISRFASEIASTKMAAIPNKEFELTTMSQMVDEGIKILSGNSDLEDFGKLLHESWMLKRSLSGSVSNNTIDDIYSRAIACGATGGKILGAGGGGFILFYVKPEYQSAIKKCFSDLLYIPFGFENYGSQLIFSQNHDYNNIKRNINTTVITENLDKVTS